MKRITSCSCCFVVGHQKQLEEVQKLLQLETIAAAKTFANRQAQEVVEKVSAIAFADVLVSSV